MESSTASSGAERSQARTVKTRFLKRTGRPTDASNRRLSAVTLSIACRMATLDRARRIGASEDFSTGAAFDGAAETSFAEIGGTIMGAGGATITGGASSVTGGPEAGGGLIGTGSPGGATG